MRIQYEHFREQQKKINAMEKTVKDLRDWAMRADNNKFFRRAVSLQIKLDKMDRIDKPIFEKQNMKLNLKAAQRSGNETIKARGISKSFGDKVIFNNADLLINFGERVIAIEDNAFNSYAGNYDYYKSIKDELRLLSTEEVVVKNEKIKKLKNIDESKKWEAEKAKVETTVESLENEIRELDLTMAASGLDYEELNKLYCRKNDLSKEMDAVMELWLSFND